jgi:hypothetical protein
LGLFTGLRYRVEGVNLMDLWLTDELSLGVNSEPLDQFKEAIEKLARKLKAGV